MTKQKFIYLIKFTLTSVSLKFYILTLNLRNATFPGLSLTDANKLNNKIINVYLNFRNDTLYREKIKRFTFLLVNIIRQFTVIF